MTANAISVSAEQAPPRAPIDWTHLARYTFGDKALESEVLVMFAEQAPLYLKDLSGATTAATWQGAAHTLKGCARSVGAWRVADAAETAEMLWTTEGVAEADRSVVRKRAVEKLTRAVDEVCAYIGEKVRTDR